MEPKSWDTNNDTFYKRLNYVNSNMLWAVPADQGTFRLIELRNKAALKIQSFWRGCLVRKICKNTHTALAKEKAAIIIQRGVRRWIERQKEMSKCKRRELLDMISDEELAKLQQEVEHWQAGQSRAKFEGFRHLEENHREVQSRLSSWQSRSNSRQRRAQQVEAQCAQLEATCILLQGSPALSSSDGVDLSFYECLALSNATRARLNHKQQLRILNAPWWKRLELQDLT